MNDILFHIVLFLVAGTVIVIISCMFTEADDGAAMRSFPRRWITFFGGCALVTAIMLIAEHTFASIH